MPDRVSTVAIIPARGGSKGIPGKNLRTVGGVPLIGRAVTACRSTPAIDATYVSTDDAQIAETARTHGAGVILRPAHLAGDEATSESAVIDALDQLAARGVEPATIVFVQATSPFIDPADLERGVELVVGDRADSVFAGVETHEFLWRDADPESAPGSGYVVGQNHDAAFRPRRQDRRPDFRETGAFYVFRADGFRHARHRFFGRIRVVPTPSAYAVDIDTPADLELAEALARGTDAATPTPLDVDLVITDFDGVHTDDHVLVDSHGTESVRVSRGDGMGVARLRAAGVPLVIVSTERNPVVSARGAKLQVDVWQGVDDKLGAVRELIAERGVDPARVAYLGNDVNDLPAMTAVGWPVAVRDARAEVLHRARLVLDARGGDGAVRELCELVIAARAARAVVGTDADSSVAAADAGPTERLAATTIATGAGPKRHAAVAAGRR